MRTLSTLTLLFALTVSLVGCNTLDGVGEDLEQAGENIEEAAE